MSERFRLRLGGEKGFAVLEILIVVSVLGVALAVGVPSYLGLRGGSADGKTWSVKGPNPSAMTDPSATKGWFEGDHCR